MSRNYLYNSTNQSTNHYNNVCLRLTWSFTFQQIIWKCLVSIGSKFATTGRRKFQNNTGVKHVRAITHYYLWFAVITSGPQPNTIPDLQDTLFTDIHSHYLPTYTRIIWSSNNDSRFMTAYRPPSGTILALSI